MPSSIAVLDLISSSMRLVGALAAGETPTPDEYSDALLVLNDLYEQWNTNSLAVWGTLNQTFNLVPGQSQYTIGPGGNFNTLRPVDIIDAYCSFSGVDFPIKMIAQEEFNLINLKTMQQPIVERMVYVNEYPMGYLILWPVPSQATTITLSIAKQLTTVSMGDTLSGPPGFTKALRYALALELAPEFGAVPSDVVVAKAAEALGDYKLSNRNQTDDISRMDDALLTPPVALYQRGY